MKRTVRTLTLLAATAVVVATSGTEAFACGGVACRRCARQHAVHSQVFGAAPQQYFTQSAPQFGGAQNFGLGEVKTIIDLVGLLGAASRGGGGGGVVSPPPSNADNQRINERFEELKKRLDSQQTEIRDLVASQDAVGNKLQQKFDELEKKIGTVQSDAVKANDRIDSVKQELEAKFAEFGKKSEKTMLELRRDEKISRRDFLSKRLEGMDPNTSDQRKKLLQELDQSELSSVKQDISALDAKIQAIK